MGKIVVFASGNGSNFEAIVKSGIEVVALIVNNDLSYAIERAKKLNIDYYLCKADADILEVLRYLKFDLIVLAGYMKIISTKILTTYPKIVNIHPSLLPKYKGLRAIEQAYTAGDTKTGITIHYIDEKLDEGSIISQYEVDIRGKSLAEIEKLVHSLEYRYYPQELKKILNGGKNEKSIDKC